MPEHDGRAILQDDPTMLTYHGRRYWTFANGQVLPVIEGAEGEGEGGGADSGGDGGAGTGGGGTDDGGASGSGSGDAGEGDEKDPRVREARSEAISERQKRQKLETDLKTTAERLQQLEDKDKSDLEKAQGDAKTSGDRVGTLEAENRNLRLQLAFSETGRAAGAVRPEKLWRHADDAGIEVEYADDGNVVNAKPIVDKLKTAMPELFGAAAGSGKPGSADQGTRSARKPEDIQPGSDRLRAAYAKD